jgi:hypothetical protein
MNSIVFLLQSDSATSTPLAASLSILFDEVAEVRSFDQLRSHPALRCATALILDLEKISLPELEALSRDIPEARIICMHRLADEQLWSAALNAGATDCCSSYDIRGVANAARGLPAMAHSVAA